MANPALKEQTLKTLRVRTPGDAVMTKRGVFGALTFYLALVCVTSVAGWYEGAHTRAATGLTWGSLLGAFVLSLFIIRSPKVAKWLGIFYALLEGFALGFVSQLYNAQYHGIVLEAVGVTLGVALAVWFLYGTGVLRVTSKVYRVVLMATIGAAAFYGASLLILLFGGPNLDASGGVVGILLSLVLAGVAASNFLIDLDRVEQLLVAGAGAEYDWYMAFSMLLSLLWLYLEILRVLSKMRR